MSRLFNPNDLLSQNLAEGSTRRDPLPAGEVVAQIAELKFSDGTVKKQGPNFGNPWSRLDCKLEITDPEYLARVIEAVIAAGATNLGPGWRISAVVSIAPGLQVRVTDALEQVTVAVHTNQVSGVADPGQPITVTIKALCTVFFLLLSLPETLLLGSTRLRGHRDRRRSQVSDRPRG